MTDAWPAQRVGEVMVAHTERVEAQCYAGGEAPPLGALLRIGAPPVYAVVRSVWNEPLDPGRPLAPRGGELESEDEIYAANPQLKAMLATRFAATVVGCRQGGSIRRTLPARPPDLHAFVFLCAAGETAEFAGELGWLRLLLADRAPAADAALAAFLRRAAAADAYAADRGGFLRRAGRILATELAGEPQRLQAILRELAL